MELYYIKMTVSGLWVLIAVFIATVTDLCGQVDRARRACLAPSARACPVVE
jgi:hypothetical protein